jgi:hypothetical protein
MKRPLFLFVLSLLAIGDCLAQEVTLPANAIMRSGYSLTSLKAGTVVEVIARAGNTVTIRCNGQVGTIEASSLVAVTPTPAAPETRSPAPATAARAPFVSLGDRRFYRIFATDSPIPLREYIPDGEAMEHWSHLVSVRVLKDLSDPANYLQIVEANVAKSNPSNRSRLLQVDATKDLVLDFLVFGANAASQQFAEWSLMRCKYVPGAGLVVFQYAVRYYTFGAETGAKVNAERDSVLKPFEAASFREEQPP